MKKIILFGLGIFVAVLVAACGGSSTVEPIDEGDGNQNVTPVAPSFVNASDNFNNKIVIGWGNVGNATSYDVYWHTADDSGTATLLESGVNGTSHEQSPVVQDTTYYYWVKAKNAIGSSDFSVSDSGISPSAAPNVSTVNTFDLGFQGATLGTDWALGFFHAPDEDLTLHATEHCNDGLLALAPSQSYTVDAANGGFYYTYDFNANTSFGGDPYARILFFLVRRTNILVNPGPSEAYFPVTTDESKIGRNVSAYSKLKFRAKYDHDAGVQPTQMKVGFESGDLVANANPTLPPINNLNNTEIAIANFTSAWQNYEYTIPGGVDKTKMFNISIVVVGDEGMVTEGRISIDDIFFEE